MKIKIKTDHKELEVETHFEIDVASQLTRIVKELITNFNDLESGTHGKKPVERPGKA